jgi:hypothetical protein
MMKKESGNESNGVPTPPTHLWSAKDYRSSTEYLRNSEALWLIRNKGKEAITTYLERPNVRKRAEDLKTRLNALARLITLINHVKRGHTMHEKQDFLTWWKRGIDLVTPLMFDIQTDDGDHHSATDKWQLQPKNKAAIYQDKSLINEEQCRLLAVMCSIYQPGWGGDICGEWDIRSPGDLVGLPEEFLHVIFGLLTTYKGW